MAKKSEIESHYHRVFKDGAEYDRWRERNCVRCSRRSWCRIRSDLFAIGSGSIWIHGQGLHTPGYVDLKIDGIHIRVHCKNFEQRKRKTTLKPDKPKFGRLIKRAIRRLRGKKR